jgi:putative zinc finger/helix-turn-helix YgiT family protein
MICLKCDNEEFALKSDALVEQEFRGERITVASPVMVCKKCGWQTLIEGQMDELGRRTSDAYRERHNLLTSGQIRDARLSLNMTQQQFADFLRVGVASIKRWENWHVQDPSSDELIRVKCMMARADQKSWVVNAINFSGFPSVTSWTALHTLGTIRPATVAPLQNVKFAPTINLDNVSYTKWLGSFVCSGFHIPNEEREENGRAEATAFGFAAHPNLAGPSPPQEGDESRFSFPMLSRSQRVSEKKTITIPCK